ncbi:DUF2218 domain-containing protein [Tropicimonas sp. TH_r6]|uniref:DUF2218 domain-containing protein n=1 Tax=Tropicimonas sp. TH_r6 TaxID=3082085 RepID=UPI002955D464|nr:DUF2218 domain-containing protein [Tropicimonas sp. TH_r6]MDV7143586.1 DUF2218 domain-containing protein [Tropicimonas sp. TH_r6]
MESRAVFRTEKASQYIASLCQHFGRKVPAKTDGATGRIEFPFGQCSLKADAGALELTVAADDRADLEKAAEVVGSHLERFAFRENPEITWHTAEAPTATR